MRNLYFLFFVIPFLSFTQTNLIDVSTWVSGTGSVSGFNAYGQANENLREIDVDPSGANTLIWKAIPSLDTYSEAGGWQTDVYQIDYNKTYRFTIWAKKINSQSGKVVFKFSTNWVSGSNSITTLGGNEIVDPYFFVNDLPGLNNWYLLVGFVHQFGYTNTTHLGGVYDPISGNKLFDFNDYIFKNTAIGLTHIVWMRDNDNTSDELQLFGPTLYEVNGSEPTIEELLSFQSPPTQEGYWSFANNNVFYNDGNVGIGTSIPDSELTVKGTIHSEEVKVDLSVPAPDYVFKSNYNLKSLEKLQEYISIHGHLPNIPSAREMETNGVELGIMNMKLLEKIEEIILYTIQQQKEINSKNSEVIMLKKELGIQNKRLEKIEKILKQ